MIHCSWRKSAESTVSSVGKMDGMLVISSPSINAERQTAISAKLFLGDAGVSMG
jgi:hypothetical protein